MHTYVIYCSSRRSADAPFGRWKKLAVFKDSTDAVNYLEKQPEANFPLNESFDVKADVKDSLRLHLYAVRNGIGFCRYSVPRKIHYGHRTAKTSWKKQKIRRQYEKHTYRHRDSF